ncbi:MAG: Fe(2+)-trafficking protein [Phycisphaerales bacterium]
MDINERISRFEALIAEEPDNDMAHFSLAGAYQQAGRPEDAARAYVRCTEVNPDMSKAFQLGGQALAQTGQTDAAIELLQRGYVSAMEKGDLMPAKGMKETLESLGAEVPTTKADEEAGPADMTCAVTGKPGSKIERAPFKGGLGDWLVANVTKQTWDEWLGLGTKIINELRLDLSRDEHEVVYDYAMRRYLRLSDEQYAELTGEPARDPGADFKHTVDMVLERMGQLESFQGDLHKQV